MPPYEDDDFDKTFRSYALKHFEIHASQRMQAFRFFIILALAGVGATMQFWNGPCWRPMMSAMALMILSGVFFCIDLRTWELVNIGREALIHLDKKLDDHDGEPHVLALFATDNYRLKNKRWWERVRYSKCFQVVFVSVFLAGSTALWIAVAKCNACDIWESPSAAAFNVEVPVPAEVDRLCPLTGRTERCSTMTISPYYAG